MFPCFMRPGRQSYVIVQENGLANQAEPVALPDDGYSYYLHKCIVENRTEDVPPYVKPMKVGKKERKFNYAKSIWADWKRDTSKGLDDALEADLKFCKLTRFVKPPETEVPAVQKVLRQYMPCVNEHFHYLISRSQYPAVREIDYREWVEAIHCVDERMDISVVERDFKAANFVPDEYKSDGFVGASGNALNRT